MTKRFRVLEIHDAEYFVGDLFRRVFHADPPNYPRHFVCLYRGDDGGIRTAGYAHFSAFESIHLLGGLVSDKSLYSVMPAHHRAELPHGSIAELLLSEALEMLKESSGVFAIIGDARSVEVNRNVGLIATHIPNLYVAWKREFPEEIQRAAAERVMRVAPF